MPRTNSSTRRQGRSRSRSSGTRRSVARAPSAPTRTGKLLSHTTSPNPEGYVACSAPFYRDHTFRGFGTHTDYSILFSGGQRPGIYTSYNALIWGVGDSTERLRTKLHLTINAALDAWFDHCRTWHIECILRHDPDETPSNPQPWFVLPNGVACRVAADAEKQMLADGFDAIYVGIDLEQIWHRINPGNTPEPWYLIENGAAYRNSQKAIEAMEHHGWTEIFMAASLEIAWPFLQHGIID